MSNLIFVSGDFSSGSTLIWTLFRKTGEYHCLYEPLHERLLEYLIWPLWPYDHHYFAENYFAEYKGFRDIPKLFHPEWGNSQLYLPAAEEADNLYHYLNYLISMSYRRSDKVLLQFNRATFRLGWLRAKFPQAKVVHIYRNRDNQWNSIVRRVQAYHGKFDVGQNDVQFYGMNIAGWCEDLKDTFPELRAENSKTGYERFCKLWELSIATNQHYADVSVDYWDLTHDFETVFGGILKCVHCDIEPASLKQFVIPPEKQKKLSFERKNLKQRFLRSVDDIGRKQASLRVRLQRYFLDLNHRKY